MWGSYLGCSFPFITKILVSDFSNFCIFVTDKLPKAQPVSLSFNAIFLTRAFACMSSILCRMCKCPEVTRDCKMMVYLSFLKHLHIKLACPNNSQMPSNKHSIIYLSINTCRLLYTIIVCSLLDFFSFLLSGYLFCTRYSTVFKSRDPLLTLHHSITIFLLQFWK